MALGFLNSKIHQCEFQLWLCKGHDFILTLKQLKGEQNKNTLAKTRSQSCPENFPYAKNMRI